MSERDRHRPETVFGFTENEVLFDRVSHSRFETLFRASTIHKAELSTNSYGEFLFVTLSRAGDQGRIAVTFFGLGYHEPRERWLTGEWFWYRTDSQSRMLDELADRRKAEELVAQRRQEVLTWATTETQSERGKLFELLADLTDDDGTLADMEWIERLLDDRD